MAEPTEEDRALVHRDTARIIANGKPASWLGANFWSRTGGPLMWRSYDPAVIREELAVLASHGLTMTRSFFYWPDFMPGPREIDEKMASRFGDFLDRHAEQGMSTIPTCRSCRPRSKPSPPMPTAGRPCSAVRSAAGRL